MAPVKFIDKHFPRSIFATRLDFDGYPSKCPCRLSICPNKTAIFASMSLNLTLKDSGRTFKRVSTLIICETLKNAHIATRDFFLKGEVQNDKEQNTPQPFCY